MTRLLLLGAGGVSIAALALQACGSDSSTATDAGSDSAASDGSSSSGDGGSGDDVATSDGHASDDAGGSDATTSDANDASDAGPLLAPLIDLIQTVPDAGVKLGWTNNTTNCDAVLGEWKTALVSYHQVFSVSGSTTMYVDTTPASDPNASFTNYTYHLRCQRGGAYSPYSNEESAYGK